MTNQLHIDIGKEIKKIEKSNIANCVVKLDQACQGTQNIPLFSTSYKSSMTRYCNVDILILKDDKISVIIEIDESNIKPTQICGKFLTSAIAKYYIHEPDNVAVSMSDSVLFIQLVSTDNLKTDLTSKIEQFRNIEESIQKIIPLSESKITKYLLFPVLNSKNVEKFLFNAIMNHLNS